MTERFLESYTNTFLWQWETNTRREHRPGENVVYHDRLYEVVRSAHQLEMTITWVKKVGTVGDI